MRSILDTSVLLGPAPSAIEGEIAISAASIAELHFGVLAAANEQVRAERLRRVAVIERTFDAIPIDGIVARAYGRLAAVVAHTGRQPRTRVMDLLIAATAAAHQARLYTRNPADLVGLDDELEIIALG